MKFGTAEGTCFAVPNFTLIRESCRPCWAKKKLKIACRVNAIPAVARPVKRKKGNKNFLSSSFEATDFLKY